MKHQQLNRVKNLLGQALGVALQSMPHNKSVAEARTHMRQALDKINLVQKKQNKAKRMTQNQFEGWWGNIQSGTSELAASPMSSEAKTKSLSQLDSMIEQEKRKIQDLEKNLEKEQSTPNQLLKD